MKQIAANSLECDVKKSDREPFREIIKKNHSIYIDSLGELCDENNLRIRFVNLKRKLRSLLRKEFASANSIKLIPNIARIIFGLHEDISRLNYPQYSFDTEKEIINLYVREYLADRKQTKYSGECASYGETLLNCYLDIFITLTVLKTPKEIGARPTFLVNPNTGSNLELDILFEDFRLAFEFQGEHHYQDVKVQKKDLFKLAECAKFKRILIPVNVSQLNSTILQTLIANSLKDHVGLHSVLATKAPKQFQYTPGKRDQLGLFCKAIQRLYLSEVLFDETLTWLNDEAKTYIMNMASGSPVSANTPAPRLRVSVVDLDLTYIYKNLRYVNAIREYQSS